METAEAVGTLEITTRLYERLAEDPILHGFFIGFDTRQDLPARLAGAIELAMSGPLPEGAAERLRDILAQVEPDRQRLKRMLLDGRAVLVKTKVG